MKQPREDDRRRDGDVTDAEPLAGSGFEHEQPEADFNGDPENSEELAREDEQ
jgi:hypothetical protein